MAIPRVLSLGLFLSLLIAVIGSPVRWSVRDDLATQNIDPPAALELRDLFKRQCVPSGKKKPKWNCDGKPVSMQEFSDHIAQKGYAAGRVTMFYTKLNGGDGVPIAKCWADNHPNYIPPKHPASNAPIEKDGYVMFDMACDAGWSTRVSQDYRSHEKDLGFTADQFMKCKSQALAEQASGDVYFFISKGDEADPNSAWVGWEFPALKRNDRVTNVWRVDPRDPNNDERELIWKKGDEDKGPEPRCKADGTPR